MKRTMQTIALGILVVMLAAASGSCMKSNIEKNRKTRKKQAQQDVTQAMQTAQTAAARELHLKTADVLAVFAKQGWTTAARQEGLETEGETLYEATDGDRALKAVIQKMMGDTGDATQSITFYVGGAALRLNTGGELPAKVQAATKELSPEFMQAITDALANMNEITGRGEPRRVGSGYLENAGWKCVLINYSQDRKEGPIMMVFEKIDR